MRTLFLTLITCLFVLPAYAKYSGGTGEPNDPYQIATAEDLMLLGESPDDYGKHFILTADIDLDPNLPGWKVFDRAIIAPDANDDEDSFQGTAFTGVFDGNDHTISNLTIEGGGFLGLFGQTGYGAKISNLGLEEVDVNGVGDSVGGLVGGNGGSITNCYSTGSVSGQLNVGGLVGCSGNITTSYSTATVTGSVFVGGLVGGIGRVGTIIASYSTGKVNGDEFVGGLVGLNDDGSIINSYSTGAVSGNDDIGGLVGSGGWGVSNSFWDMETSGLSDSSGGVGLTTAEMKIMSTFIDWWCPSVWTIDEGNNYPHLWWEGMPGKIIGNPYKDGAGTAEDPYLIYTVDQLNAISPCAQDKHFMLMSDIDLSGFTYDQAVIPEFAGVFDGNGHVISHLTISGGTYLGLFGQLVSGAIISNLALEAVNVNGTGRYVGGLVGYNEGNITSCSSIGSVNGEYSVGGLVGWSNGSVTFSYSTGSVNGFAEDDRYGGVGGLVGRNEGNITSSYSTTTVTGRWSVGGLVGLSYGSITACHSSSSVNGYARLGGLVAWNEGNITSSYSIGEVSGNGTIGGLAGENRGRIATSYSISTVDGNGAIGGLVGSDFHGIITTSHSIGAISGTGNSIGGLVGETYYSIITTSYSTGTVSGDEDVGGLVGYNNGDGWHGGMVAASYSTCTVNGNTNVGGLVGNNRSSITTCYSTGPVKGAVRIGGLVGRNVGSVASSFWDIEISGQLRGGGGLTTAEMKDINAYLSAGWDFVDESDNGTCDYWQIIPGDYPQLRFHFGNSPIMPDGMGTTEQPYLIRDARDLGTMWSDPTAHYRLEETLDLSGITWPIAVIPWFEGTFDGNGHMISNLHIQGTNLLGLFGTLSSETRISHLGLEGVNVNGIMFVGGLVGHNEGTIASSYCTGKVIADSFIGGLVGYNKGGSITTSYSISTVEGSYRSSPYGRRNVLVGGLVGANWNGGSITASYSIGSVSGRIRIGGLAGSNGSGSSYGHGGSSITMSYSACTVSGSDLIGGLVGDDTDSITTQGFWDMDLSSLSASNGGTGLTTAEMQTSATFIEAGWDFVNETDNGAEDIWWILEGRDYPRLWWEAE
jgi:hypothetical protein